MFDTFPDQSMFINPYSTDDEDEEEDDDLGEEEDETEEEAVDRIRGEISDRYDSDMSIVGQLQVSFFLFKDNKIHTLSLSRDFFFRYVIRFRFFRYMLRSVEIPQGVLAWPRNDLTLFHRSWSGKMPSIS